MSERSRQYLLNKKFIKKRMGWKDPRCWWCNKPVVQQPSGETVAKQNTATVDHIYSKRDLRRSLVRESKNIVLSCYECNERRNHEEQEKSTEPVSFIPYLIGMLLCGRAA